MGIYSGVIIDRHGLIGFRAHPTIGISFLAAMGNITPPMLAPEELRANAKLFLVVNQCDVAPIAGPMMNPHDSCRRVHVRSGLMENE